MNTSDQPADSRLREIFLRALEIPDPGQRERYLAETCAGEAGLLAQVRELLANDQNDSFLQRPAVRVDPPTSEDAVRTVAGDHPEAARTLVEPSAATATVHAHIRYFGDYEVLGEIARGGMGVVYRARQKSLNRIVALKMIRAGRLADEAEVLRFRTEAEAAANLQHPNIVAIHEIGEHEGQHYFSMDYVEGKDLAKLVAAGPLPTAKAAGYVRMIAEAIAYAHERGTLHRDLKPHNVLIDQQDKPRITDFGLAKLTKQDSTLTQEGVVMGSPSYMPPEQAAGKTSEVGPQSDVYSIGAVLYHLLTGRAPFAGETAVATMRQVLEEDPAPPSRLNPKVPEDLETICLKCLQKSPSQRYASARELADELGRFLNFEPILARPASRWRRTWSWAQRSPWVFAGTLASLVLLFACLAYGMFEHARFVTARLTPGRLPSQEGVDSPSILFFKVLPLVVLLLYFSGKAFRRGYQRRESEGSADPLKHWWLHVGLGVLGIVAGLVGLGLQIKAWAWSSSISGAFLPELISVICALGLNWLGFYRVWEVVGMHETSRFRVVVDKVLERDLAVEGRGWSPFRLVFVALWLWFVTGWVIVFLGACWTLARSGIGVFVALTALLFSAGLMRLIAFVVRERRRLFTFLLTPLMLALFVFALGALVVGSSDFPSVRTDIKMFFPVFLCSVVVAALVALGRIFFLGGLRKQSGDERRFPVKPWIDLLLAAGLALVLLVVLRSIENWRGKREWSRVQAEHAAKGDSLDYDSYLQPPVADAENVMASSYMKAHFLKGTPVVPISATNSPSDLATLKTWPKQSAPGNAGAESKPASLQGILDAYARDRGEFAQLEAALQLPHSRVEGNRRELMKMPIPNLTSFRTTARAYEQLCKVHLLLGDSDAALEDLRKLRRVVDVVLFNQPPPLVTTMFKVNLAGVFAGTVEETLAAELWPPAALERVQSLVQGVDLLPDLSRSLRFGERLGLLAWADTERRQLLFGSPDGAWVASLFPEGWADQQFARYARAFQFCLTGLDLPGHRVDARAIDAGDKGLQQFLQGHLNLHDTLAQIAIPNVLKAYRFTARKQTLLDQAQVAMALERYRAANGAYPESLDSLVPRFAATLPADLFDGQKLRYRPAGAGRYQLYSVGWNSRDDGGKTVGGDDWMEIEGDWVWKGVRQVAAQER